MSYSKVFGFLFVFTLQNAFAITGPGSCMGGNFGGLFRQVGGSNEWIDVNEGMKKAKKEIFGDDASESKATGKVKKTKDKSPAKEKSAESSGKSSSRKRANRGVEPIDINENMKKVRKEIFGDAAAPNPKKTMDKADYDRAIKKLKGLDEREDANFGNGGIGTKKFDPKKWSLKEAKTELEHAMKGWEKNGVDFTTETDFDKVMKMIDRHIASQDSVTAPPLKKYLKRLRDGGQLLGVVYRGVTGGKAVGHSYFSDPQYIDIWAVSPDGKGLNISLNYEFGD